MILDFDVTGSQRFRTYRHCASGHRRLFDLDQKENAKETHSRRTGVAVDR
jgi:hypothetical protein